MTIPLSLTTVSIELHTYATNSMEKCVHPNTVVKMKDNSFSVLAWHVGALVAACSISSMYN